MTVQCIDLSSNNARVDLPAVQAFGIGLVGLRGTIGRVDSAKDIDQSVYPRAKECLRLGLPFYVYGDVFARAYKFQDAERQALDLWRLHNDVGATIVPMQDVEPEGGPAPNGAEWRVACDAFADVLETMVGKPCITYTGPGFWSQYRELIDDAWIARTHLHMAAYLDMRPAPPAPWTEIAMWQKCGGGPTLPARFRGLVSGVQGDCDRSELYVPLADLAA
jgi:GH25 family lysozyme M1 (1,4-beta-N-acetylmuramidase)